MSPLVRASALIFITRCCAAPSQSAADPADRIAARMNEVQAALMDCQTTSAGDACRGGILQRRRRQLIACVLLQESPPPCRWFATAGMVPQRRTTVLCSKF